MCGRTLWWSLHHTVQEACNRLASETDQNVGRQDTTKGVADTHIRMGSPGVAAAVGPEEARPSADTSASACGVTRASSTPTCTSKLSQVSHGSNNRYDKVMHYNLCNPAAHSSSTAQTCMASFARTKISHMRACLNSSICAGRAGSAALQAQRARQRVLCSCAPRVLRGPPSPAGQAGTQ